MCMLSTKRQVGIVLAEILVHSSSVAKQIVMLEFYLKAEVPLISTVLAWQLHGKATR